MSAENRINLIFAAPLGFTLGSFAGYLAQLFALGYGSVALILIVGLGVILGLDHLLGRIGLHALDTAVKRWGTPPPPPRDAPRRSGPRMLFAAAFAAGVIAILLGAPVDRLFEMLS